jgi:hypothetical protein
MVADVFSKLLNSSKPLEVLDHMGKMSKKHE